MSLLELSRCLFLSGALPFIVLGLAHAAATPQTPADTRRATLWLAWVGFNLSHSLGAILFGAVVVVIGRSSASFETQASVFLPLAVLVTAIYLVLGVRYWFKTPSLGSCCPAHASWPLPVCCSPWQSEPRLQMASRSG